MDEFLSNSEKRFATIKQIEIIGEACARITSPVKDKHPAIEWNESADYNPNNNNLSISPRQLKQLWDWILPLNTGSFQNDLGAHQDEMTEFLHSHTNN